MPQHVNITSETCEGAPHSSSATAIDPDAIAAAALATYASLPERGKPKETEWTVLAAFVIEDTTASGVVAGAAKNADLETGEPTRKTLRYRTVALGTGSKCLGRGSVVAAAAAGCGGAVLRDSHAEILARRALVRLFYLELARKLGEPARSPGGCSSSSNKDLGRSGSGSIDEMRIDSMREGETSDECLLEEIPFDEKHSSSFMMSSSPPPSLPWTHKGGRRFFRLRKGTRLHLYVSEPPCGDAAISRLSRKDAGTEVGGRGMGCASMGPLFNFTGAKLIGRSSLSRQSTASVGGSALSQEASGEFKAGQQEEPAVAEEAAEEDVVAVREPGAQATGVLRLKSARSNLR